MLIGMAGSSPAMTSNLRFNLSNSQASAARVFVRRRVRLSWYPQGARGSRPPKNARGGRPPKNTRGSGAPTGASTIHACEARRASCAVDKFTRSAQTSTRHARLSALHRGDFGRRDYSDQHPDRPFGLLIPQAFACIRPGAIYQLWRALLVGPGSTPRLPEMACETIRRRRTRSANQDASRWRPRMSRQQHDTELVEEKGVHAGDVPG